MAYLIRITFHWFGGHGRHRERGMPLDLDDHTLRDIGITRQQYHFLPVSDPFSASGRGGGRQI
jgi:uncharacterized protein YjiS (DUF1127 family)